MAAETVPCGLINAGLRDDIFSMLDTLIPLSFVIGVATPGTWTGIRSVKYPFSNACWARLWDLKANSSCSFLDAPNAAESLQMFHYIN